MRFIGDIHGKLPQYHTLISSCNESVQVGDFGIGFIHNYLDTPTNHKFIRGNHDDPGRCKEEPNWIVDGTFDNNIFYVGGASSIDRHVRTPGVNWWFEEQLSIDELMLIGKKYYDSKPDIMVTHECPDFVSDILCKDNNRSKFSEISNTRNAFNNMFMNHKPKLWIFGHWHTEFDKIINGTRFICLGELSYIDIDVEDVTKNKTIKWRY